ncbi:Oxysterol-binding protein OBPa [Rhizina undulata]
MLFSSSSSSSSAAANASKGAGSKPGSDGADTEEEVVVEEEKNMLLSIISQLRPGADLSRITLPTFILEPKSMLERITNFMQHPETLLPMSTVEDPTERFLSVVKFYLSGWHIKPPGVKKPLNPILGEYFTCYWDFAGSPGKQAFYVAEQTSHHPPKSSYFYMSPHHHIRIDGTLKPQSRFLGNSAASMMNTSIVVLRLLNRGAAANQPGGGEKYILTQPNMYVRGILFGKMKYELGDHSYVKCSELDLVADIEFKVKGFFTGAYNAIGGQIKKGSTGEALYELSGSWNGEMFIKDLKTGKKELFFDATDAIPTLPAVRPFSEQDERESQKLWRPVVAALKKRDQEMATDEKFRIEDRQREEARTREAEGVEWKPRFFRQVDLSKGEEEGLDWVISARIDGTTPEEQTKQILAIAPILPGSKRTSIYDIPPHHNQNGDELENMGELKRVLSDDDDFVDAEER